jgi:hypothetical protein
MAAVVLVVHAPRCVVCLQRKRKLAGGEAPATETAAAKKEQ